MPPFYSALDAQHRPSRRSPRLPNSPSSAAGLAPGVFSRHGYPAPQHTASEKRAPVHTASLPAIWNRIPSRKRGTDQYGTLDHRSPSRMRAPFPHSRIWCNVLKQTPTAALLDRCETRACGQPLSRSTLGDHGTDSVGEFTAGIHRAETRLCPGVPIQAARKGPAGPTRPGFQTPAQSHFRSWVLLAFAWSLPHRAHPKNPQGLLGAQA